MTSEGNSWHGRFRAERKRLIIQDDLVKLLGITRRAISRWENGRNYPADIYRPALAALSPTMKKLMEEIPAAREADHSHLQALEARIHRVEQERAQLGPELMDSLEDLAERVEKLEAWQSEREAAPARSRAGRPR